MRFWSFSSTKLLTFWGRWSPPSCLLWTGWCAWPACELRKKEWTNIFQDTNANSQHKLIDSMQIIVSLKLKWPNHVNHPSDFTFSHSKQPKTVQFSMWLCVQESPYVHSNSLRSFPNAAFLTEPLSDWQCPISSCLGVSLSSRKSNRDVLGFMIFQDSHIFLGGKITCSTRDKGERVRGKDRKRDDWLTSIGERLDIVGEINVGSLCAVEDQPNEPLAQVLAFTETNKKHFLSYMLQMIIKC